MRKRLRSSRITLVALLVTLGLGGCGRRGDPVPPGLRLPEAPSRVAVSGRGGVLTVSWRAPREDLKGRPLPDLAGYLLLRAAWPPGESPCDTCPEEFRVVATVDREERRSRGLPETAWTDPDLRPRWTYRYRVRALDPRGRAGPPSAPVQVTWLELDPPRVDALPGDGQALVSVEPSPWPEDVEPLGVRVYGPDGRLLATAGLQSREIVVPGLQNRVEWRLSVHAAVRTAEGWEVESRGSAAAVTPVDTYPPLPPSPLVALVEPNGVQLRWLPAGREPYATVIVLRARDRGPMEELSRLPGDALQYLDTTAEPGHLYRYSVVAVDAEGNESLPAREERVLAR